jgi:4a-hydroxytetrahydrobiopterin dehydratase
VNIDSTEQQDSTPTQPLSGREIDLALRELRGWGKHERGLRRRFRHETFMEAIRFVNEVAQLAEAANHHPDIDIRYRNVIVFLTTHDVGGVSQLDIGLARQISEIS